MFAHRLKELRKKKNMTQVQLAELLDVSKGTIAMWEIGKREPNFEMLGALSDIFDRRIDYILGYSNDDSSPMPTEEDMAQLDIWKADESFYETIMAYLRLDEYGKYAVESVIKAEVARCRECDSLFPEENFKIVLRIKNS